MPANRVAALSGVLAAVVAAVVSLLGAFESDTAKAVVLGVVVVAVTAIVIVFLIGAQRSEKLQKIYPLGWAEGDVEDPLIAGEPLTDPSTLPADRGDRGSV